MDVGPRTHTCPFPGASVGVVQGAGGLHRTYGRPCSQPPDTRSLAWALRLGRCCGTVTPPHLILGATQVPSNGVPRGKLQQPLLAQPHPQCPPSPGAQHTHQGLDPGQTGCVWYSPATSLAHSYLCASWLGESATQSTRKEFTHSCAVVSQSSGPPGHRVSTAWAQAPRAFGDMCSSFCSIHSWCW